MRASGPVPLFTAASLAAIVACTGPPEARGLTVVAPTSLGEGHGDDHSKRGAQGAPAEGAAAPGTQGAAAPPASSEATTPVAETRKDFGSLPDPAPLVTVHQWDLSLHYAKGKVSLEGARAVELPAPVPTPRRIGRFAVELWIGKELVDRVRFDFPLLGAEGPLLEGPHPDRHAPRFSPGADTRATIRVPASDRATYAQVVDRLSGAVTPIPWPPAAPGA